MKCLLALALLFPALASAGEYQLTPTALVPAKAARDAAANVGFYVISHEGLTQGVKGLSGFNLAATERVINSGIKICYGPASSVSFSVEKPAAPFVCVEDQMTLARAVNAASRVKKYNLALKPPLTEESFAAKIDTIVTD